MGGQKGKWLIKEEGKYPNEFWKVYQTKEKTCSLFAWKKQISLFLFFRSLYWLPLFSPSHFPCLLHNPSARQSANMGHDQLWNSHPKNYGKGSRQWYAHFFIARSFVLLRLRGANLQLHRLRRRCPKALCAINAPLASVN